MRNSELLSSLSNFIQYLEISISRGGDRKQSQTYETGLRLFHHAIVDSNEAHSKDEIKVECLTMDTSIALDEVLISTLSYVLENDEKPELLKLLRHLAAVNSNKKYINLPIPDSYKAKSKGLDLIGVSRLSKTSPGAGYVIYEYKEPWGKAKERIEIKSLLGIEEGIEQVCQYFERSGI